MQMQLRTDAIGSVRYDKVLSALLFLYCLAMPFEEALVFSFGGIMKLIGFAVIGWCLLAHYKTTIKVRNLHLILPFFWWFIFSILSAVWSKDHTWWWYFIKVYASQILLVLVIASYQQFVNVEYLKNGVVSGAVIAAAIIVFLPTSSMLTEEGRRTIIIFDNQFDPNILASIMMMALIITLDRIFEKKKNKLLMVMAALILLGILLTGSRGALISTVVGVVVYFMLRVKDRKLRRNALLIALAAVAAIAIVVTFLPEELISSRFTWESIFGFDEYEEGSHNRWTIWEHALPLSLNAPILGYGCGNFFYAIATVYRETASHNLYILLLIEGGIVGLSIFSFGLLRLFRASCKVQGHFLISVLVALGVMSLTLDAVTYKYFWIGIIVAVLSLRTDGAASKATAA